MDLSHGGSKSINNKKEEVVIMTPTEGKEVSFIRKGGHPLCTIRIDREDFPVELFQLLPISAGASIADILAGAIAHAKILKKGHFFGIRIDGVDLVVAGDSTPEFLEDEFRRIRGSQSLEKAGPYKNNSIFSMGAGPDTRGDC